MRMQSRAMDAVILLLKVLIALNLIAFALIFLVLVGSFTDVVVAALQEDRPGVPLEKLLPSVRAVLAIALLIIPFAHLLLTRLTAIVETVRAGDPFVTSNAGRLTVIAWCLLAIQLLDLTFGVVAITMEPEFGWSFSLTGWLAVILLFVLAKVFDHGTRMREELEGTI